VTSTSGRFTGPAPVLKNKSIAWRQSRSVPATVLYPIPNAWSLISLSHVIPRLGPKNFRLACDEDWYRILSYLVRIGRSPVIGERLAGDAAELTAKNRVHLDVRVAGRQVRGEERKRLVSEHVERLVQAGASIAWQNDDIRGDSIVMRDPEGNEFCVT